jgi:hypothetical protein
MSVRGSTIYAIRTEDESGTQPSTPLESRFGLALLRIARDGDFWLLCSCETGSGLFQLLTPSASVRP